MILYYDAEGKITATSTWTLANPATYEHDGYLMITGVGQRPLPVDAFCFDFQPDASPAMAALMLEIEADKDREHFTVIDGVLCKDAEPVHLDFMPGSAAAAQVGMAADPQIVAFFGMTDEQLGGYVVTNFGYSARQAGAFVVIRNVLRDLARAAGVAKR